VSISHFPRFSVFLAIFRSYSVFLSFSTFFSFLALIRSYIVYFSFSTILSVSQYISLPIFCVSHFPNFSIFSPYSRSYSVHFSFSPYSVFLPIFHILQCVFLIFHYFEFSCHDPGPTVCISHFLPFQCSSPYFTSYSACFSFFMIFCFLAIFQTLQCAFLIFHVFECVPPYSRSNSV
jgi:hypothetical protein